MPSPALLIIMAVIIVALSATGAAVEDILKGWGFGDER